MWQDVKEKNMAKVGNAYFNNHTCKKKSYIKTVAQPRHFVLASVQVMHAQSEVCLYVWCVCVSIVWQSG